MELERGEDIDLVGQLLLNSGENVIEDRRLEQVKHKENSISLRSPAVLEAFANFHDHRVNNPDVRLRFCFLTNARIAIERMNPFPNRISGISLWERIRTRQLDAEEVLEVIKLLRSFLTKLERPDSISQLVWDAFQEFVKSSSIENFEDFIAQFEWSIGRTEAQDFPTVLCNKVLHLGLASEQIEAVAFVERLFCFVARLLTTAGLKQLTVKDRDHILTVSSLAETDLRFLKQIMIVVGEHSNRLDSVEANLSTLDQRVTTLLLANNKEQVVLTVHYPDISLPIPVARLSPRPKTARKLHEILMNSAWLAIHGGPDTGKSQLTIQIAEIHGDCGAWIRFRNVQSTEQAANHLNDSLAVFAEGHQGQFKEIFARIGARRLVILDDLPRIPGDDPFAQQLIMLCQTAQAAGIHVLSTSQYELPMRIRNSLGESLTPCPAPAFNNEEAKQLFVAYGAPVTFFTEQRLHFLNGLASGHPMLLSVTAEFLASRKWMYSNDEIDSLLRGDHSETILPEVIERLVRTVGQLQREYLYRLTLPIGTFGRSEVGVLAEVTPAIHQPQERFTDLLGAWIQRESGSAFAVSPLVKTTWED